MRFDRENIRPEDIVQPEVSIVMPCLNEERTIRRCIEKAQKALGEMKIRGEIVVVDNGSTDKSVQIAESKGARVVKENVRGYGSAYLRGVAEASGRYIVMGDSDDSYDFLDIERFIRPLQEGFDMVIGSRLKGKIMPGAMPWHHRYFGNPGLSWFLNLLFKTGISDAHCGMRSFTKEAYKKMRLQMLGMELASEMVVKASLAKLKIKEIPITLYKDGRDRKPHLRSFRDGWRHLRFLLLYSPTHLFIFPGVTLMLLGFIPLLLLFRGPVLIGGHAYDAHVTVFATLITVLGFQIVNLGLYAKAYSYKERFEGEDEFIERFYKYFKLEKGIAAGLAVFLAGFIIAALIFYKWLHGGFGGQLLVSKASMATTLMIIGMQTVFSSFLLSIFDIRKKKG